MTNARVQTELYNNNPMTEVSLALAMAFFTLMVLAIFSMGNENTPESKTRKQPSPIETIWVQLDHNPKQVKQTAQEKVVYVFWNNDSWYGADLNPFVLEDNRSANKIILAVPPEISAVKAMEVRQQLAFKKVVITTFTDEWRKALDAFSEGKSNG